MGDNDLSVKENPWRKKSTAPSPPPEIPATPPATPDDEPPPPKTFDSVFISGHLCPPPLRQQAPFIPDCLGGSIGVRFVARAQISVDDGRDFARSRGQGVLRAQTINGWTFIRCTRRNVDPG